ncbi:unnamed protein product, partial [Gulo gulo]
MDLCVTWNTDSKFIRFASLPWILLSAFTRPHIQPWTSGSLRASPVSPG